jgi:hypothetical protein
MRNFKTSLLLFGLFCSNSNKLFLQNNPVGPAIGNLIQDAIYFTKLYITPATDAAVYQAASRWVNTTHAAKLRDFTLGLYVNAFIVPKSDRSLRLNNSTLSFF